jgi:DNA-binding LacI/PurR family transcriptional regulator
MSDVAALAQVSIATVSYVVNGSKPVLEEKRLRVEQAIAQLGFKRNAAAAALASKKTRNIALLFPALQHALSDSALQFFTGAAQAANDLGYNLLLSPVNTDAESVGRLIGTGLVDGVLLMQVELDDPRVARLKDTETPFVLIGRTSDPTDLPYVDIDFDATVRSALDHLRGRGHTRICFIDSAKGDRSGTAFGAVVRAEDAYLRAMADYGLDPAIVSCDDSVDAGRLLATHIATEATELTAVLLMNSRAVIGLMAGFRDLKVEVPGQISVMMLMASAEQAYTVEPELSLMVSPGPELGRLAVQALIDQVEGRQSEIPHELIECSFYPGRSIAEVRPA